MPEQPRPRGGPFRIASASGPWPLHHAAAARALETEASAGRASHALMEAAGLAVARLARALAPNAGLVEVWCGPGNNGGDGHVAARQLHLAGTRVRVVECGPAERLPADAKHARAAAVAAGLRPVSLDSRLHALSAGSEEPAPSIIIDALLGLGASRPPEGPLARAIALINDHRAPVLAVDLPSGLHPDTGQPLGSTAVRAEHTLALLSLKPGLFTGLGRDLAGSVWFDGLGFDGHGFVQRAARAPQAAQHTEPTACLLGPHFRQPLPHAWHKGRRGDAWVVGGASGMVGAASLAARAALAAGAGRVYLSSLGSDPACAADPQRPELMCVPFDRASAVLLATATTVAGCGGGGAVRDLLPKLLAGCTRLVLDADALNHVAAEPALMRLLRGRGGRGQGTVLTPHPLEAARLLRMETAQVQQDRLARAAALAEATQAVVVLKGSGTVVAAPGSLPRVNSSGHSALATAGTGDVLAGWMGGLWAQDPAAAPLDVASTAVWQHGHAADVARPAHLARGGPLLAADLIGALAVAA